MLKVKRQSFGHLMQRVDSFEKTLMLGNTEGRRRRKHQKMRWLYGINGPKFEQTPGDGEGEGGLLCCSPWGHRASWPSNWTATMEESATVLSRSVVSTLCSPTDCSPPGSSVHGIFQARVPEWVAISYSRGSSRPTDQTHVSCVSCTGSQILYH